MAGCKRRNPSDRISNLPENIIENIIGRLAIQDLVRTSVLSRNWRHKWTTLPDLVFDDLTLPSQIHDDENKLVGLVYNILLKHNGPISKFSLSIKSLSETNYFHINGWIKHYLSGEAAGALRTFILEFTNESRFEIPYSLFSCVNLRILRLQSCIIPSPPTIFIGFNKLTYLQLENVSLSNEGFENLIAKCPQLAHLLLFIDCIDRLNIVHAPKLKILYFAVKLIKSICLEYTPNLSVACLYSYQPPRNGESMSLTYNLNFLSNLRMFTLGSYYLKSLAQYRLPSTLNHLSYLGFTRLMFEDIDSVSSALELIESSPNVNKLFVSTGLWSRLSAAEQLETVTKCLEERSTSIGSLKKLRYVEMNDITGLGPEMQFMKMLLVKSPLLEEMKIQHAQFVKVCEDKENEIEKELIQFPRASAMAKIIYIQGKKG